MDDERRRRLGGGKIHVAIKKEGRTCIRRIQYVYLQNHNERFSMVQIQQIAENFHNWQRVGHEVPIITTQPNRITVFAFGEDGAIKKE